MGKAKKKQVDLMGLSFEHNCARVTEQIDPFESIYKDKRGTNEYTVLMALGGQTSRLIRKKHGWGNPKPKTNGKTRGCTFGLTPASRRSLMDTLKQLNRDTLKQEEVLFLTFTYDGDTDKHLQMDGREYKRHLKNITHALSRKYGGFGVWKFELQDRLVGHYHMVWYKVPYIDIDWLSKRWNEITGGSAEHRKNGVDLGVARSWDAVDEYCTKVIGYMSKAEKNVAKIMKMKEIRIGRCWGSVNKKELRKHINLEQVVLSKKAYIDLDRQIRKLRESWDRKVENFKGLVLRRKWHKQQMGLGSLTRTIFMENEIFRKLVEWAMNKHGLTATWMSISNEFKGGFADGIKHYKGDSTSFKLVGVG